MLSREVISLPMHTELTPEAIAFIATQTQTQTSREAAKTQTQTQTQTPS
jgi:hypothetical protein